MTETPQPPDPNLPPAGFYPDGHGVTRYWDGRAWTEQTQALPPPGEPTDPIAATPASGLGAPSSSEPKSQRPWFKKKRFIISGAVVALIVIAGIAGGSETDDEPVAAATTKTSDTDGDGVSDKNDAFPEDPDEWTDVNDNGVGDNADDKAEADAAEAKQIADEKKAAQAKEDERKKKIDNAEFASERDLSLVFKDPDSRTGELFKVWGEVTQFDAATGIDTFLANTASSDTRSYGYFEGENAIFAGDASALEDFVEDDLFVATVEVAGSLSYDTQMGGNTTVPQFTVLKIERMN